MAEEKLPYTADVGKWNFDVAHIKKYYRQPAHSQTVTVEYEWCKGTTQYEINCGSSDNMVKLIKWIEERQTQLKSKQKGSLVKDLFTDLKKYASENRDLLYTIIFVLIIDEYVFGGAFRERVKGLVEGFLKRAEDKVGVISVTPTKVV